MNSGLSEKDYSAIIDEDLVITMELANKRQALCHDENIQRIKNSNDIWSFICNTKFFVSPKWTWTLNILSYYNSFYSISEIRHKVNDFKGYLEASGQAHRLPTKLISLITLTHPNPIYLDPYSKKNQLCIEGDDVIIHFSSTSGLYNILSHTGMSVDKMGVDPEIDAIQKMQDEDQAVIQQCIEMRMNLRNKFFDNGKG